MRRIRLRTALLNGVLLLLAGLAWLYLAPARVGGFTTYVVTHGVSMEPRFHSGDLALVRPSDRYGVGDVVAYHSSLLGLVVLHRIVAIHNDHYVFKGDNNHFLDPVHPTRHELIGKLWLHLPRAGAVVNWPHSPAVGAAVCGLLGLFLLWGVGEQRQRRRRRRGGSESSRQGPPIVNSPRDHDVARPVNFRALLTASALAVAVFVVLAAISFVTPSLKSARLSTPYTQRVSFGYRARVAAGPVYPNGTVKTSDPIFLSIVRSLDVRVAYRFTSAAPSSIAGTEEVVLKLLGASGWSRSLVLTPPTRFVGNHTSTDVTINLRRLQALMAQVERLTAVPAFSTFSVAVQPILHVRGALAGRPLSADFQPALTFQVSEGQLQPSDGSAGNASGPGAGSSSAGANYTPSQSGTIGLPGSVANDFSVLHVSVQVAIVRWISLVGLLLSTGAAVFFYLRKRGEPFEESYRIRAQYGHMIVPIVAGEDLGWPPVDVRSIKALVQLAESGQRLILHSRSDNVDTYLVNDEGTVYRYQVRPSNVVWGDWSDTAAPVQAAA